VTNVFLLPESGSGHPAGWRPSKPAHLPEIYPASRLPPGFAWKVRGGTPRPAIVGTFATNPAGPPASAPLDAPLATGRPAGLCGAAPPEQPESIHILTTLPAGNVRPGHGPRHPKITITPDRCPRCRCSSQPRGPSNGNFGPARSRSENWWRGGPRTYVGRVEGLFTDSERYRITCGWFERRCPVWRGLGGPKPRLPALSSPVPTARTGAPAPALQPGSVVHVRTIPLGPFGPDCLFKPRSSSAPCPWPVRWLWPRKTRSHRPFPSAFMIVGPAGP